MFFSGFSYSLGGSLKVSENGKLKAQVAIINGDRDNSDVSQLAIAYDYKLDLNTIVYVAYARTSNDSNVNFSANGKGHGDKVVPAYGSDPSAISLGIIAKFDLNFPF